jgi:hypothetical protein
MKKFTRTLTVLAASAALTLTGVSTATAQSSISDLDRLSSRITEPDRPDHNAQAERELRDAAVRWAQRTTNRNYATLNDRARDASLPSSWNWSPVDGTRTNNYNRDGIHYRFYQVEKNKYRNMVTDFNNSGRLDGYWNGNYGVHARTHGDHVYVTVAFRR